MFLNKFTFKNEYISKIIYLFINIFIKTSCSNLGARHTSGSPAPMPAPGPWGDASYASSSTVGAEELGRRAAAASAASTLGNASASTPEQPGTPEGFTIEVAVLNLGMPTKTVLCTAR